MWQSCAVRLRVHYIACIHTVSIVVSGVSVKCDLVLALILYMGEGWLYRLRGVHGVCKADSRIDGARGGPSYTEPSSRT